MKLTRKGHNCELIVLVLNDTSTLVGHFVLSPREREKRDRGDSRGEEEVEEMKERDRRERKINETEETEEIKIFPPLSIPAKRIASLVQL